MPASYVINEKTFERIADMNTVNLDWEHLGYEYVRTDRNYIAYWSNGAWDTGKLVSENTVTISLGSTANA